MKAKHGWPRRMWADIDPTGTLAIYETKAEQRAVRPDLKPIRVLIYPEAGQLSRVADQKNRR